MPITSRLIETGRNPDILHETPLLMISPYSNEIVLVDKITDARQYGVVVGLGDSHSNRLGYRGSYWTGLVPHTGSCILENKDH